MKAINEKSFKKFRNTVLKLGQPIPNLIYRIHHLLVLKLLTRLRLGLSHLKKHRFKHDFKKCINLRCTCSLEIEATKHFLLHSHYYSALRISFLNYLNRSLHYFLKTYLSRHHFMAIQFLMKMAIEKCLKLQ